MCKISDFMTLIDEIAPLSLSYKMIEKGCYDNSGLLVKMSDKADKILFTLDLSDKAVLYAIDNGFDTILTHHPAIYSPIKTISIDTDKALAMAIKQGINIISMHLNLDVAKQGIDCSLCQGLGGKDIEVLDRIDADCGYGRKAKVKKQTLNEFAKNIKDTFGSDKVIVYGDKPVENIASFCGSGGTSAIENLDKLGFTDTVISSDFSHHHIKELIEKDKNVVIIPHYASEQFGFYKFYELVKERLDKKAQTFYFLDNRFM